jgi:O-antigen/teichoic acid export membrane protein
MLFKKEIISSTAIYITIKYLIVFIGFARTTVTANILTVSEMGYLALILLILEYAILILPIGSFGSLNRQIANLKAEIPSISYLGIQIQKIYSSSLFIIISFFVLFSIIFLSILSLNINFFSETITNSKFIIVIILFLSLFRVLGNVHNRLWDKFNTLSLSELAYAIFYLFGSIFFIKGDNKLQDVLYIIVCANIFSIFFAQYIPSLSFFIKFSKNSIKKTSSIGFFMMLYLFMESFFWGIDRIFVAILLSTSDLANFHIAHTFSRGVMMFYLAIIALVYPKMITMFTAGDKNKDMLDKNMIYMIKFTESFLVLAVVVSSMIIPNLIKYVMPAYGNLGNLFLIISIGMLLKGLFFFPSTYFVSVNKQKWLTLISLGFLCFLCSSYIAMYPFIKFTPVSFTSIAIVIFFCFLTLITFYYFKRNFINQENFYTIKKIILLYFRLFIICFGSVILLNMNDLNSYFSNLHILVVLILFLYLNNIFKYSKDLKIIGKNYFEELFNKQS